MPPLPHDAHERFAQAYLVAPDASDAYRRSRGRRAPREGDRAAASRLRRRPEVAARIAELQDERAERCRINADAVLRRLEALAFGSVGNFFPRGPDGKRRFSLDNATDEELATIAAISIRRRLIFEGTGADRRQVGEAEKVYIRMEPKFQALVVLGRHLGLFDRGRAKDRLADELSRQLASLGGGRD